MSGSSAAPASVSAASPSHETLTQLAVEAARAALEQAGVSPQELGLCLTATVSPDCATPSQACLIHQALHLPEDCPAFDLSAGCTGFLYAMETSAALLPRMARPYAPACGQRAAQPDHRHGRPLHLHHLAATAWAPQWSRPTRTPPGSPDWAPAAAARSCGAPGPGQAEHPYLHMNGQEVFKFALETVPKLARELLDQAGLDKDQVDWYVPHQANHRIVESVAKRLKVRWTAFMKTSSDMATRLPAPSPSRWTRWRSAACSSRASGSCAWASARA